ncbi:MAG: GLUG motif-containing protein, partial [bacterium]
QFKAAINAGLGGNYMLMKDIDMSELGTVNRAVITGNFVGTLDGNGYKIKNLTINSTATNSGLFGQTTGATIKNVILENTSVSSTADNVGTLIGESNASSVTNTASTNANVTTVGGGTVGTGGLIGYLNGGNVTSSYSSGNVSGVFYTGGLIGLVSGTGNVSYSYSSANVFSALGGMVVGGLFGGGDSGSVSYSYATGNVTAGSGGFAGGLVGESNMSIISSYATGNITGSSGDLGIGGIAGQSTGSITSSYSTGSVSGGSQIGGIAGQSTGSITSSYSTGNVSGTSQVGGIAGDSSNNVFYSYSTGNVSGNSEVGGLIGRAYNGNITSSYTTGSVSGSNNVGGFVGFNSGGTITSSSSSGKVTGSTNVGGFAGSHTGGSIDNTNFWNKDSSGQATSAGSAIGKTSAQFDAMTPVTSTWNSTDWDTTFENPVLKAIKNGNINMQTGAEATKNSCYALKDMGLNFGGELAISLDSISSAQSAISSIDKVMTYLSSKRSDIGVGINALSGRLDTNSTRKENFISSSGVLKDTDMAVESAKFTKQQILRNMGMSMLQQSKNMQTSSIQQLLGL